MAQFMDLREWIKQAEGIDELVVLEGTDLKSEIGTVCQINARNDGPAVLHQGLAGFPNGFRVITNLNGNVRTTNLTLGLPPDASVRNLVEKLKDSMKDWETNSRDFSPRVVRHGPILEHVVEGDAIDLSMFPVPTWHELDGGPYIGTAASVITRDPDTGHVNCGTYRGQLFDGRCVGSCMSPGQHGRLHRDAYFKRGEPCPMVMVFGPDPLLFMISGSKIPQDICELNYAGAVRGQPYEVIKGRVTGLPIPARAEIAIEGFLNPTETRSEGPFGEWTGYYGDREDFPFLRAETLYYRDNPILCGCSVNKGAWGESMTSHVAFASASLYRELLGANALGVTGVWRPRVGGGLLLTIVSVKQLFPGHATQVGVLAAQAGSAAIPMGRYVIVVDDDIDPYDLEEVMWAVCTRSRPEEIDLLKRTMSDTGDPAMREPQIASKCTTARAIIYAVEPYERLATPIPVAMSTREDREETFRKFRSAFRSRWEIW